MIGVFDGEFAFLSNFFDSPIEFITADGKIVIAPTVEHYFQAAKAMFAEEQIAILSAPTPGKSKRLGRHCLLRPDWEVAKEQVMYEALVKKFAIPELREKLLATGDEYLEEGTTWHDNEWGVCHCIQCQDIIGKNKLGKLLMRVRMELMEEKNEAH